ncbi:MAG: restriction endonuclease subunit S [Candidatus Magasanikbacteria bacterium]|nr:restriction endonuclease subunit S [Candidatus Magasanikbacteria bacterium]
MKTETATKFKGTEIGTIPEEWSSLELYKFAELVKDAYLPSADEELSYIGLEHINQQALSLNSVGKSSDVTSNKFRFKANDILFGKLRPYFRKVYRPKFSGICSTDIWVARAKTGFDQEWLFWLFASEDFINSASGGSSGTRMPRADWSHLKDIIWPVPKLSEQQQIAEVLSSLNEKIELNRRINANLEILANSLFKKWFIDIGDELPDGWRLGTFGEAIINFDSKRIPLSSREREKKQGSYPYYGATSIVDYVNNFIFDGIYVLLGEDGSVVKEDGKPFVQYVQGKIWVNNHAHVLQGNNGFSTEYIKVFLDQVDIMPFVTGAVQPKINQANMNCIPMIIPDQKTLDKFNETLTVLFRMILENESQTKNLEQVRDSLLPRMMSGKIRVN